MKEEFFRTASLIGEQGFNKLQNATVAVFGIGGVGSFAAESLVRAGVGSLFIYDNDTVSKSNINRQLIALHSTIGKPKPIVAKERYYDINPDCIITESSEFITPESKIPFEKFNYIIDAVDNVTAKLFLICGAQKAGTPIISIMGTGNKLDPTKIQVSDIYKTKNCPLARVIRSELKKRGIKKQNVVWSDEISLTPQKFIQDGKPGRIAPGSLPIVPAVAGLTAASVVIQNLIK